MKVLSIEQMNRLKEFGIDVNPKGECLMYTSDSSNKYYLKYGESTCEDDIKAFTLQDVMELLPMKLESLYGDVDLTIQPNMDSSVYVFSYEREDAIICWFFDKNILDAAYNMLIWVIENNYLKTK